MVFNVVNGQTTCNFLFLVFLLSCFGFIVPRQVKKEKRKIRVIVWIEIVLYYKIN